MTDEELRRVAAMVADKPHEAGVVVMFAPAATEAQIARLLAQLIAHSHVARLGVTYKPDVQ